MKNILSRIEKNLDLLKNFLENYSAIIPEDEKYFLEEEISLLEEELLKIKFSEETEKEKIFIIENECYPLLIDFTECLEKLQNFIKNEKAQEEIEKLLISLEFSSKYK